MISPSPYDFGPVSPGQSAVKAFILTNSGRKATGKLRVRLSGAAAFSITGGTCRAARLRPGKTCTVTVRFAPSQADRITATLTAASKGGPRHAATASDVLTGGQALGATPGPGQIYWVSSDEIWAANLDGTSPHAIVTGQIGAAGIAVNSSHLYWADAPDGTIWEANLNGSSPHTILTSQRGGDRPGRHGQPDLLGQQRWRRGPGRHNLGRQPGRQQPAHHRHRPDSPVRGGGRRQPRLLGRRGGPNRRERHISEANPDGTSPHAIVTGQTTPTGVAVDPATCTGPATATAP